MRIRTRAVRLLSALMVACSGPLLAAEARREPIPVHVFIEEALRSNPGLRAARERWEAASERPAKVRALPDPKLSVSKMAESLETRAGPIDGKLSVSQGIPFYRKRALRGEAAERGAEVANQAYRSEELRLRAQVVRAYYDLYYLRRAVEVLREQVDLFRHFARVAEKKYAVGKGPQAMVFRAQAELSRMQNEVVTAEQEVVSTAARLNSLLDRKPWTEIGPLEPPPFPEVTWSLESLRPRALDGRPELKVLKALEGKSEAERKLAFKRFFPDFVVGYELTRIDAGTTMSSFDGKDAHGLMLGLSIPLWGRSLKAGYREAKAKERAAGLSTGDVVNRTLYELEDLHVRADTAMRLAKVDEDTILPQIRSALKATLSGYESDAVGFLDLLDVERTLLRLELGHIKHKVMFRRLVAEMERVVGGRI